MTAKHEAISEVRRSGGTEPRDAAVFGERVFAHSFPSSSFLSAPQTHRSVLCPLKKKVKRTGLNQTKGKLL